MFNLIFYFSILAYVLFCSGGEMRNNVEYEINSDYNNCNRQQHIRREDMIIRHANEIDPYSGNINSSPNGYSISSHNFIQKEETLIPEDYTRHENNGSEVTVPPDEHLLLVSTNTIEQSKLSDCSQPYPRSCDYINEEERSITQEKIFPYESKIKLEGNGCILTPPSANIGLSVMNPCNKSISSSEIVQNESWESKRINETYIKSSCSKCHYSFCQSRGSELLPKRSCEPPSLPSFVSTFRPQPENGRVYSTSRNFSLRTSGAPYNSCLPMSSDSRCSVSNSYTGSSLVSFFGFSSHYLLSLITFIYVYRGQMGTFHHQGRGILCSVSSRSNAQWQLLWISLGIVRQTLWLIILLLLFYYY